VLDDLNLDLADEGAEDGAEDGADGDHERLVVFEHGPKAQRQWPPQKSMPTERSSVRNLAANTALPLRARRYWLGPSSLLPGTRHVPTDIL
jgi:hypothetical protein